MALRRLVAMVIFWPELWRAQGEAPHPCFASEAIPLSERRFFSFAPANVLSGPPVDCVFVFGGPPGSLLRLGLYDVRTMGPPVFLGQESAKLCGSDVIRVYDVSRQGLQLQAAYCGLLRRGRMLSMSSNMAVVTYTSDSNDPGNAFNLGVDAIDVGRGNDRRETTQSPCRDPSTATSHTTTPVAAIDDPEKTATMTWLMGDRFGDWVGASGDSESEDQGEAWYGDNGSVAAVISTGGEATPPASEGGARAGTVKTEGSTEAEPEGLEVPPSGGWNMQETGDLEGEDTGKVVTVYSNGTGDEEEDALAFFYYV